MRFVRWFIQLFKKPKSAQCRVGYGYTISDEMFNRKWGGKYNDVY